MRGAVTSEPEVTQISRHGIWLLVGERELFLPHDQFPWFRRATVEQVLNVVEVRPGHLHWPDLDVDLTVEAIEHPERYPLVARD